MLNCEDYKQLSNRFAQLAIASSAPTVAKALMAIAFDYASRAATVHQVAAGEHQKSRHDQIDGFGD
jgi:hypothetical protein